MPLRVRRWVRTVAVAALVAGCTPSDGARIERRADELAALLSKEEPEDAVTAAGRARRVASFFGPGFLVVAEPYGERISDRRELVAAVGRYRQGVRALQVALDVDGLEVREENRTARMTAEARVRFDLGGEVGREVYRLRLGWAEEGGEWGLREVELLEVVEDARGLF